tara:strand:- start:90 stop:614 length:525 start_codon:yes stop_codon:yes gene_type:complete
MNDESRFMNGWLYILGNKSMPDLYKVGQTTRSPEERAKELSGSTGVATPFYVIHSFEVDDVHIAEKEAHTLLSAYRVSNGREFFKLDEELVLDILGLVANRHSNSKVVQLAESSEVVKKSPTKDRKSRKQRNLDDIRKKNSERLDKVKRKPVLTRAQAHAQITKQRNKGKAKTI